MKGFITGEIKTDGGHLNRPIAIQWRGFDVFLYRTQRDITSVVHLQSNGHKLIAMIRIRDASSEPLIEDKSLIERIHPN